MKLHFYQLSKPKAFLLGKETLTKLGFTIRFADNKKGVITASKMASEDDDVLFFNILISYNKPYSTLNLFSNMFCATDGTFVGVKGFEESFCECLKELINKKHLLKTKRQPEEDQVIVLY